MGVQWRRVSLLSKKSTVRKLFKEVWRVGVDVTPLHSNQNLNIPQGKVLAGIFLLRLLLPHTGSAMVPPLCL